MSEQQINLILQQLDELRKEISCNNVNLNQLVNDLKLLRFEGETTKDDIYKEIKEIKARIKGNTEMEKKLESVMIHIQEIQDKPNKFWGKVQKIEERGKSLFWILFVAGLIITAIAPNIKDIINLLKEIL